MLTCIIFKEQPICSQPKFQLLDILSNLATYPFFYAMVIWFAELYYLLSSFVNCLQLQPSIDIFTYKWYICFIFQLQPSIDIFTLRSVKIFFFHIVAINNILHIVALFMRYTYNYSRLLPFFELLVVEDESLPSEGKFSLFVCIQVEWKICVAACFHGIV